MSNYLTINPITKEVLKGALKTGLLSIKKIESVSHRVTQGDPCWSPPRFPEQGRLPLSRKALEANMGKIESKEVEHRKGFPEKNRNPCCKSLHVSLFFDGTNNNEPYDTKKAKPPHPSNVAKLYHACAPNDFRAIQSGFFAYYLPGVGTPFPEIGTNEYYSSGLTFASGGEDRITWALINVCDTLYYEVNKTRITTAERRRVLRKISSRKANNTYTKTNDYNPLEGIFELLSGIRDKLLRHMPKLVALKLYIYGFSRGSAEARTFVYWLERLLSYAHDSAQYTNPEHVKGHLYGIPVSVEFLGLFDTVAAVGMANTVPMMTGHNGWAGGTQQLPKSDLVKCCYHFTAAHEQRQAFCLDSIRTPEGNYPPNSYEIIYPGMHSDVGGAYPVGDQGKSRNGDDELLSQIALHDMYATAIDAGAPLAISETSFALLHDNKKRQYSFRKMTQDSSEEFAFSPHLVDKFNHWVTYTLPDTTEATAKTPEQNYCPPRFIDADIERAIEVQLVLITPWRIGRYASQPHSSINLTQQPFFQQAPQHAKITAQPYEPDFGHQAVDALTEEYYDTEQEIKGIAELRDKEQKAMRDNLDNWVATNVGTPTFDATNARGQLWEAALEFTADYHDVPRPEPLIDISSRRTQADCIRDTQPYLGEFANCESLPKHSFPIIVSGMSYLLQLIDDELVETVYMLTNQDERREYEKLKEISDDVYKSVIYPQMKGIAKSPETAKVIALFDDYIHDSRAWFMHSESGIREPYSSYFLSRMIYFGDNWNKSLRLITPEKAQGIPMTPTGLLAFYYLPTYGLRLYNTKTGQKIPFDDSQLPPATNKVIVLIREVIKAHEEAAHRGMIIKMRDIANSK